MNKNTKNLFLDILILLIISLIGVFISFIFTIPNIDKNLMYLYLQNKEIVFLNLIPILLLNFTLYFISGKLWLSTFISSIILLAMGVINISKLNYRYENIRFADLSLIKEATNMVGNDYSIILPRFFIIILLTLLLIVVLIYFTRKYIIPVKMRVIGILISLVLIYFSKDILLSQEIYANNKVQGFNEWIEVEQEKAHGMIYSFFYSINDVVAKKPEKYNEKKIASIWNSYDDADIKENEKINIIAIMLESYNDFSKFGINFSKYPYESFDYIKKNSLNGRIVNDMFGGGTAFVERYFLRGSFYYSRYYRPVNSFVWYFKNQGYSTVAMHPHNGGFYNRLNINPKLGFDKFYYMENYFKDFNKGGKHFIDDNLYKHILKDYEEETKNNNPYFNFTVTMQNHGPYDDKNIDEEYIFRNNFSSDESYNIVNNYFHGIKSSSDALKDFLEEIDKNKNPTLVILFGDHNPFLGDNDIGYDDLNVDISGSTLSSYLDKSTTPYIIWGNNSLENKFNKNFIGQGPEISTQYLMNYVFKQLGWKGPKYMQIIDNEMPKLKVFNDRFANYDKEYYYSDDKEFEEIQDFIKSLDYYNNDNFYYHQK